MAVWRLVLIVIKSRKSVNTTKSGQKKAEEPLALPFCVLPYCPNNNTSLTWMTRYRFRRVLLLAGCMLVLASTIRAQTGDEKHDSEKGNFEILPALAPTSSPELGLTLVGAAVMSFRLTPSDTISHRSTIATSVSVSTKKAILFGARIETYAFRDRLRVEADVSFRDMPDHYWGLGFDRASTIPKGDSTTSYDRAAWWVRPIALWRATGDVFAGINIDLNYTYARDPNPVMREDPDFVRFGPKNFNSGIGLIARFDSRDVPNNAFSGWYAQFKQTVYNSFLGGENNYHVIDLDYRQYQQIGRPGSTLAWTARTRITTGSAPYAEVSQIGSARDLRGYRQGQYRDQSMVFGIVEYRHMLKHFWSSAKTNKFGEPFSRHGLTVWAGLGTIGQDGDGTLRLLPNYGFGYRFVAIRRTSVRVDFGFGRDGFGFYLDFAEAF
jgi:hypothetical protein